MDFVKYNQSINYPFCAGKLDNRNFRNICKLVHIFENTLTFYTNFHSIWFISIACGGGLRSLSKYLKNNKFTETY